MAKLATIVLGNIASSIIRNNFNSLSITSYRVLSPDKSIDWQEMCFSPKWCISTYLWRYNSNSIYSSSQIVSRNSKSHYIIPQRLFVLLIFKSKYQVFGYISSDSKKSYKLISYYIQSYRKVIIFHNYVVGIYCEKEFSTKHI